MSAGNWAARYIQPPPPAGVAPTVERTPVGVSCPACGGSDVRRYPVATAHGARLTTKCQDCLHIVAVERPTAADGWPPFRAATYGWDAALAERASRERQTTRGTEEI